MTLVNLTDLIYDQYKNKIVKLTESQFKNTTKMYLKHRDYEMKQLARRLRIKNDKKVLNTLKCEITSKINKQSINTLFPGLKERLKSKETIESLKKEYINLKKMIKNKREDKLIKKYGKNVLK